MSQIKALLCSENFGLSWKDTIQTSSTFSEPSNESASGRSRFVVGRLRRRTRVSGSPAASSSRSWSFRRKSGVTLRERIWAPGKLSLGKWMKTVALSRLAVDVGLVLAVSAFVAFSLWASGVAAGVGEVSVGVEAPWRQWNASTLEAEFGDRGTWNGTEEMRFVAESDEEISRWWEQMVRGRDVPDTVSGGFT